MIVDASALVGILAREPEAPDLVRELENARSRMTHPVSVYEAAIAVARVSGASLGAGRRLVADLLSDTDIDLVAIGPAESVAALDAHARYGKGRHPAALNMGDCFSYACASVRGVPLLYKGDDFALTDLRRPRPA